MAKIRVENVSKIFGRHPEKALELLQKGWSKQQIVEQTGMTVGVNQVSFEVQEGEIFVIMGLSGSGKSTLVRLLNRLIEPTAGRILLDGEDIVQMSPEQLRRVRREKLGMVFQRFALFPHRNVLENVEYGLEVQGVAKHLRQQKAQEALALVGLQGWETSYPDQLSGGMQQRVGLARALAHDPDVLLMDEAFSALDPLIRKDMQDELLELQEAMRKTIVFITHDLDEALKLGDRIALLKDGVIQQIGTPEEILTNPANEYVERFVVDVDLSKVLTAGRVMKRAETITLDKGPRVAMQMMRERGVSTLFVVDKKKSLLGVLTADAVKKAHSEELSLQAVMETDVPVVEPTRVLQGMFELVAYSPVPVAVVGENRRLLGVVVKGAVLGGLAGRTEHSPSTGESLAPPVAARPAEPSAAAVEEVTESG